MFDCFFAKNENKKPINIKEESNQLLYENKIQCLLLQSEKEFFKYEISISKEMVDTLKKSIDEITKMEKSSEINEDKKLKLIKNAIKNNNIQLINHQNIIHESIKNSQLKNSEIISNFEKNFSEYTNLAQVKEHLFFLENLLNSKNFTITLLKSRIKQIESIIPSEAFKEIFLPFNTNADLVIDVLNRRIGKYMNIVNQDSKLVNIEDIKRTNLKRKKKEISDTINDILCKPKEEKPLLESLRCNTELQKNTSLTADTKKSENSNLLKKKLHENIDDIQKLQIDIAYIKKENDQLRNEINEKNENLTTKFSLIYDLEEKIAELKNRTERRKFSFKLGKPE